MTLDRLTLLNFKNYEYADITLCGNLNCFVGNNGAGKTNLLDAVYYLSFCKSFLNPTDSQNIRLGQNHFAIHGHYGPDQASCIVRTGQPKQMRWRGKTCRTLAEHIGRLPLVVISPADQQLVSGGSELRRKFVDGVISQVDHSYFDHLVRYQKALDQRARLLSQMYDDRQWDEQQIALWDMQLVQHGIPLRQGRTLFIQHFAPLFAHYCTLLAPNALPAAIQYPQGNPQLLNLEQQLLDARGADRHALRTTVGPHRDDYLLLLAPDMPAKRFGSQGQQKTLALALKLAQFHYMHVQLGQKPILLLDDVFDKLDHDRVSALIALVGSDAFGQVLLTDTQPNRVAAILDSLPSLEHRLFEVHNGTVHELGR